MQEFESIRPYHDGEVERVVEGLIEHPVLLQGAAHLSLPRLARWMPGLASWAVSYPLARRASELKSVHDVQEMFSNYFERMIKKTMTEFRVSGLEHLAPDQSYLFVSNHRDIALDSGLLSYALHNGGLPTPRSAVGDNLFSEPVAAEIMRLNKSFVVERSAKGAKAVYAAMMQTSNYIRHSLDTGHSVWIAQREGRSKDGLDRTDAALIKMLALAFKAEGLTLVEALDRLHLVPMSISYELDPCDVRKARELYETEVNGCYVKAADDDLQSIILGITGFKGQVQLNFGKPFHLADPEADAEAAALALDREIVGNLAVFPTHRLAARLLAGESVDNGMAGGGADGADASSNSANESNDTCAAFRKRLLQCSPDEQPFVLRQYANLLQNRRELGLPSLD